MLGSRVLSETNVLLRILRNIAQATQASLSLVGAGNGFAFFRKVAARARLVNVELRSVAVTDSLSVESQSVRQSDNRNPAQEPRRVATHQASFPVIRW